MFGDGALSKTERSFQIAITGNKTDDRAYLLEHVQPLFAYLFDKQLVARYRKGENTMDLYGYSKSVSGTLHSWGMPIGRKKLADLTPKIGVDSSSFVRGLFDTDGCVYCKYGHYAQVQFKSASYELMDYVQRELRNLSFHPTPIRSDDTKYRFFLCRQKEVDAFFHVIKPSNAKHLRRFLLIRRAAARDRAERSRRIATFD